MDVELDFDELRKSPNFFLIAGPCVIESREHCLYMAGEISAICRDLDIPLIFKSSFDKANRTSLGNFRGLGLDDGLAILKEVKETYHLPILTDIHESWQCPIVAKVADILQIPAFLCRQTDLLLSAGATNRIINLKKGQFCNEKTMKNAFDKIASTGNRKIILCDRGSMYGYDDLIVDFRNLTNMRMENPDALIMQDITHSLQQPNRGGQTQGLRHLIPTIARSAVATGVDGLFMEIHDQPEEALSDASTQWHLKNLRPLLEELLSIHHITKGRQTDYYKF